MTSERNALGRFQPGKSGNPGGRPKAIASLLEEARGHTEEALEALIEIVRSRKAPANARVSAATALLDRGWGRPPHTVEIETRTKQVDDMSDDQLERIAARGVIIEGHAEPEIDLAGLHRAIGTRLPPPSGDDLALIRGDNDGG